MADFAQESGHWYMPDGSPYYTVKGANGKERAVTLRDARKVGAYPSVTTIIKLAAAPQLERWKRTQIMLASLTLPHIEGESSDSFIERVEHDWQEQGKDAADRGTAIHAAIEQHFRGDYLGEIWNPWIIEASGELTAKCGPQGWLPERSYVHPAGYGCKLDLHSEAWVVDTKTKDGDLTATTYDEHVMQVAAQMHAVGIPHGRGGILFVRRDKPAALLCEISRDDLDKGWGMFLALLSFHQAKNRYRPGVKL